MSEATPKGEWQKLRQQAEKLLRGHEWESITEWAVDDVRDLVHELQVHQIELELQNEELQDTHHSLEQARARYANLYQHAPVGYLTLDEYGAILEANLTAAHLLNIGQEELTQQLLSNFVARRDQDTFYRWRRALFREDETQRCEVRLTSPAGETILHAQLEGRLAEKQNPSERPQARVIVSDISARKAVEETLRESEERFRHVFEAGPLGIFLVSEQLHFIRVNARLCAMLGYAAAELEGQPLTAVLHPEDGDAHLTQLHHLFADEAPRLQAERRLVRKDGDVLWCRITATVVHDAAHNPLYAIGMVENIARRKAAEKALADEKRRLELLYNLSQHVADALNPELVAQRALQLTVESLSILRGECFALDEDTGRLRLLALVGYSDEQVKQYQAQSEMRLQQGMAWQAVQDKEAIVLPDVNCSEYWLPIPGLDDGICSAAAIPLLRDHQLSGVISLLSDEPDYFDAERLPLLRAIAMPIAFALHNAQLYEAERDARRAAETLRMANLDLTGTLKLKEIAQTALTYLQQLVACPHSAILMREDADLLVLAQQGFNDNGALAQRLSLTQRPLLQQVIEQRRSMLVAESEAHDAWRALAGETLSECWLIVPLLIGEHTVGLMLVQGQEPHCFRSEQRRVIEVLATQTAVAMQNAQLFNQVQADQEHLRRLADQLVGAQEEERQRVSRELHDEAGQALTVLKLNLGLIQSEVTDTHLQERLADAMQMVQQTMHRVHLLAHDLRPPELDTLGLNATLRTLCQEFAERARLSINYQGTTLPRLPDSVRISLYRFLQEALTNVAKHAAAEHVQVYLSYNGEVIRLLVEDDGRGFRAAAEGVPHAPRLGLLGMKERLESINGSLTVDSKPGGGARLIATVPW